MSTWERNFFLGHYRTLERSVGETSNMDDYQLLRNTVIAKMLIDRLPRAGYSTGPRGVVKKKVERIY